jgi:hypothetical protein
MIARISSKVCASPTRRADHQPGGMRLDAMAPSRGSIPRPGTGATRAQTCASASRASSSVGQSVRIQSVKVAGSSPASPMFHPAQVAQMRESTCEDAPEGRALDLLVNICRTLSAAIATRSARMEARRLPWALLDDVQNHGRDLLSRQRAHQPGVSLWGHFVEVRLLGRASAPSGAASGRVAQWQSSGSQSDRAQVRPLSRPLAAAAVCQVDLASHCGIDHQPEAAATSSRAPARHAMVGASSRGSTPRPGTATRAGSSVGRADGSSQPSGSGTAHDAGSNPAPPFLHTVERERKPMLDHQPEAMETSSRAPARRILVGMSRRGSTPRPGTDVSARSWQIPAHAQGKGRQCVCARLTGDAGSNPAHPMFVGWRHEAKATTRSRFIPCPAHCTTKRPRASGLPLGRPSRQGSADVAAPVLRVTFPCWIRFDSGRAH